MASKFLLTLFLCFLIGLEREERRAAGQRYSSAECEHFL